MSDERTLSNSEAAARLEVVLDEFERVWEQGGRPRIEEFLDHIDSSQRPELLRELILIEGERRRRLNETPRRSDYAARFPGIAAELRGIFPDENLGHTERHLLFAVLAFESELLDLAQLTAACRAWAADKSRPLADLLVERGWITQEDRQFVEKQVARKLAKHQDNPRVTLNSVTRGDVCDVLKELGDADINQSLSSWPSGGPVLVEAIGSEPSGSGQAKSRYTWVSEVGKGGLGKVWLARDNDLVREVALKEIKPGSASDEAIRRLIKEAQITGQLQHPNIVPVYEMNRGSRPFYTMKLVKGETLAQAIKRHHEQRRASRPEVDLSSRDREEAVHGDVSQPLPDGRGSSTSSVGTHQAESLSEQRLMSVFLNICDALAYAHSRGIIHRDLKPQNIVLGDYGEAIVLDWGLARRLDQKEDDAVSVRFTEDAQTEATQAGSVMGSPPYMAPEQAAGQTDLMDQRTDVYGLGAILFAILTDNAPHRKAEGESIVAMLQRITTHESPHVRELDPSLPEELDTICAKAMAKSRDERYPSAKELKAALLEFQVHKESIDLAASAAADLELALRTSQYDDYSRARFGFEEALRQWPNNTRASDGLRSACRAYAEAAFQRGDYDLALSLLEPSKLGTPARPSDEQECPSSTTPKPTDDDATLRNTIQLAAAERASRQQRIYRLRRFGIAASLTAALIATIAAVWINAERSKAVAAKRAEEVQLQVAVSNAKEAKRQQGIAEDNSAKAITARKQAEAAALAEKRAKDEETKQRMLAVEETKRANDEANRGRRLLYVGHMNLAQTAWEGNRVGETVRLLDLFRPQAGEEVDSNDVRGFEWFYWERLCRSDLVTLNGHTGGVLSVAFSPDGKRLASGSSDGAAKVWDTMSGQEALTLKGHTSAVLSVMFSPDGKRLASASADRTVKVWDATSGQEMLTLKGHNNGVRSVAFSADGKWLASGSDDQTVKVWEATSGQETLTLKGYARSVTSVSFSPDGKWLASSSHDQSVKVWDAATGQEKVTLKGHTGPVYSVAFSPDGNWLASASYNGTVKVWDTTSGQEALTLKGHTGPVISVAFSPDGKRLASSSDVAVQSTDVDKRVKRSVCCVLDSRLSLIGV